jgi:hypothetical protein
MQHPSILTAAEELQETYSQRLRTIKNLLSTLKNTSGALSKANRSLREYIAVATTPAQTATLAQQSFSDLRLKDEVLDPLSGDLRREQKAVTAVEAALKDAASALRAESVDVIRLSRALQALQARGQQSEDNALQELVPQLSAELDEAERELSLTFGEALRDTLAPLGIELKGRPPRFEIGRFELATNFAGRAATLSYGKELVNKRVPLSVDAVIKTYQRENKAITGRNEDGRRWIEQLYQAWLNVRRKREIIGDRVNLVETYGEMVIIRQSRAFRIAPSRSTMSDYTRAQFSYDFVEFVERQQLSHNGWHPRLHASTKSQTDTPERSIWVVEGSGPFEGRYISDLTFSKES